MVAVKPARGGYLSWLGVAACVMTHGLANESGAKLVAPTLAGGPTKATRAHSWPPWPLATSTTTTIAAAAALTWPPEFISSRLSRPHSAAAAFVADDDRVPSAAS